MEQRLKADVLREAALFDNHILVTEEDDDMQVWGGREEGRCLLQPIPAVRRCQQRAVRLGAPAVRRGSSAPRPPSRAPPAPARSSSGGSR
jgi:hypothetical protein